jgi:DNA helicase II / ATP-dependent DNA helicase PcrA
MSVAAPFDPDRIVHIVTEEEALVAAARRLQPGVDPPYFGHLRIATGHRVRDVLLGVRTVVRDDVAIVDWERAPLAEVFFAHREGEPYEVELDGRLLEGEVRCRRLVTLDAGEIARIETEDVAIVHGPTGWIAEPLARVAWTPRAERASADGLVVLDAVQLAAATLPGDRSLLVLGEAGFGKTTVALHRLAHLRTRAADRPFSALVVVPTEALRRLSTLLLARLGIDDVIVRTFDDWIVEQARAVFPGLPKRSSSTASPVVSRLKRHPALRTVLPTVIRGTAAMRAVEKGYLERRSARDVLLHLFGDRDLMKRVVAASGGALPSSAVATVVAHTRLQFTDTTEDAMAHVDAERLKAVDGKRIDEGTPMQDANSMDVEDAAVMFELQYGKTGRDTTKHGSLARYDHIVVDEVQELAPIELAVLGRARAPGGTITVAGDEHQQIDASAVFGGWPGTLAELGISAAERVVLTESYRCPPEVEAFARRLVGRVPAGAPPVPPSGAIVRHMAPSRCHLVAHLIDALAELGDLDRRARVAVICRHAELARRLYAELARGVPVRLALGGDFDFRAGVVVTCVDEVRGLEFDDVVVPDATPASYPDDAASRRALYVATTRTMHQLLLCTPERWSPLVTPAPQGHSAA